MFFFSRSFTWAFVLIFFLANGTEGDGGGDVVISSDMVLSTNDTTVTFSFDLGSREEEGGSDTKRKKGK